MTHLQLDKLEKREIGEGFQARFVHSSNLTLAYWEIEPGASLPSHRHIHEQVVNVLEGEFELTLSGETLRLSPGSVVIIPSNVEHSGQAISACRILDVFYPVREDYR
jgi:quercetin dioxygenase-like cupin family protein